MSATQCLLAVPIGVQTKDGTRAVHAHRAVGDEPARLWKRWEEIDKNLDAYAARRPMETAWSSSNPCEASSPAQRSAGSASTDEQR